MMKGSLVPRISREYLKAAEEQGLGYLQLKTMPATAFNTRLFQVAACGVTAESSLRWPNAAGHHRDESYFKRMQAVCRGQREAKLQWKLEEQFRDFERKW